MLPIPWLLTYLLVLLLTLLYCWFRWTSRELIRAAAHLPMTHKTWPILGHSYAALGGREGITKMLLEMSMTAMKKGQKTACFWCGPLPLILIHDIEDIKTVLNSSNSSDKGDEYEYFKFGFASEGSLTHSMLTAPGNLWRERRKHMNPVFHPRNLDHMIPVFNRNSRELASCLSRHVGHGNVNLMPHTMDTALKTVCNLVFGPGVDIDTSSKEFSGLMSVVESIPAMFISRLLNIWLRIDAVFYFLYRKELKKISQDWNNFTNRRLEKAKEMSKQKNLQAATMDIEMEQVPTNEDPLNIVDAYSILQKTNPSEYTEAHMRSEILMFYCTGTDTVGSATASCFLALAQYPNIQERLYREVCSTVGPDEDVTLQDLSKMAYLDQVVKETLRWFLTVPYILRKATKDVKLSACTIPAGTTIMVGLLGIHMDPKIYPDPLKFDPDRFSEENAAGKERFTFVPFSGGPRNCIAKTYAMQLIKIMVVHVLRKFRLSTSMDIFALRKKLVVTLVSAGGYNVFLEERGS